jgi:hypothetical protein
MKHPGRTLRLAIALIALAAAPTSAHHAMQALFDLTRTVTVTGSITKVEWTNPHTYISVDVKGAGGDVQHWLMELAGASVLQHAGLTSADRGLRPGDVVTVDAFAARDGAPVGYVSRLHLSDGRVFASASATGR